MSEQFIKGKFETLQLLRGVAASVVVICHEFGSTSFFQYGANGVDLFFVISGFIIMYIHHADIGVKKAIKPFLIKRLIRVIPIYWLMTLGYVALVTGFGHNLSIDYILKSLFLVPQDKLPVVGVAWTLQFEILFYLIFCLLLINRKVFYPMFGLWIFSIILFFMFPANLPKIVVQLLNPLNLEFIFGCGIALAILKNKVNFKWITNLSLICIASSILIQNYNIFEIPRVIAWGIPFALLILGLIRLEMKKKLLIPKLLNFVGDASYSIYLSHLLTLLILESSLKRLGIYEQYGHNGVVQLVFCIIAILLGCIFYIVIEKPLLRLTKSFFLYKKSGRTLIEVRYNSVNENSLH